MGSEPAAPCTRSVFRGGLQTWVEPWSAVGARPSTDRRTEQLRDECTPRTDPAVNHPQCPASHSLHLFTLPTSLKEPCSRDTLDSVRSPVDRRLALLDDMTGSSTESPQPEGGGTKPLTLRGEEGA
ncbi:hypothetical protein NDU88_000279 [Pleurodeles waltl]|uniref:Uncharacterized protein n=1 Tax=Pleurodeles waltl TaxID=8319 RepID=A0AAV7UQC0_PLEWA|nr:hypothetical protein NDU88_000279 [Pleurodeles waltl]